MDSFIFPKPLVDPMATYVTFSPLQKAMLRIKLPHTCGDCGDVKRTSHMCKVPMDDTPYDWSCWACRDQNHDPDVCRVVLAQMRRHNNGHCQTCQNHTFSSWSLLCTTCTIAFKTDANWSSCKGKCNRVGLLGRTCQFCVDAWATRASVNPWARKTTGCRGCGAEGYDGDYCSRECMLD